MSKVSIIMPCYNQGQHTVNALNDLLKTCGQDFEVLVIDDCSKEPIYKVMPKLYPGFKFIRQEVNGGFIKSVNRGIQEAAGDWLLLLNNDVRISDPGWLKKLVDKTVSRKLDLSSVAGGRMTKDWEYIPGEATKEKDQFAYLVGWCLLISREVIDKIGVLSKEYGVGFFDDCDYCYRAKMNGFKLGIVEGIQIQHLYHTTFKNSGINITNQYTKNRKVFLENIKKYGMDLNRTHIH